jgi:LysR family glycine cleavage system transcriptional activator
LSRRVELTEAGAHWPLFAAQLFPVCSPRLATRIRQVSDLNEETLLRVYTAADDWQVWLTSAGLPPIFCRAGPEFDSYVLAFEAASDGQGFAIAPHCLAASEVNSGRLVRPFTLTVPQPGG